MRKAIHFIASFVLLLTASASAADPMFSDPNRTFAVPTLVKSQKGDVALSWTEKDAAGVVYFYASLSSDGGKTFSPKSLIHSSPGLGASRLFRPRVMFRPDGTLVAVFSNRVETAASAANEHAGHGSGGTVASERPRDTQIVISTSKNGGKTWSAPRPVHTDRTPMVRGFFDATVLANGEVAVAYLRDIEGKPHSRDLRMVISRGDSFGPEKVLEPFVCDCCNVSLLVDAAGTLHVYYRENKDNIRDIDHLASTDNGATFSKPQPLYADGWQLNGCPHSGPTSSRFGQSALVAWYSGTQSNNPGLRVVTGEGKRLFVLEDPSVKSGWLLEASQASVLLWEQPGGTVEAPGTAIAYRTITPGGISETRWINRSEQAANPTGLALGDQVLVAYEVKQSGKSNAVKVTTLRL